MIVDSHMIFKRAVNDWWCIPHISVYILAYLPKVRVAKSTYCGLSVSYLGNPNIESCRKFQLDIRVFYVWHVQLVVLFEMKRTHSNISKIKCVIGSDCMVEIVPTKVCSWSLSALQWETKKIAKYGVIFLHWLQHSDMHKCLNYIFTLRAKLRRSVL